MKDVPRLVIQNYLQKKKKKKGFCALALAAFPLRIYRTVDSVSCNYIAKL